MSYEDAPATKILAVYCACCGRPLLDAISVETGVGPECRKKHGFNEAQREPNWDRAREYIPDLIEGDAHKEANRLIYRIACDQTGPDVANMIAAVSALGYIKLANRMAVRISGKLSVIRDREQEVFRVKTPYNEGMIANLHAFNGRWIRDGKYWEVPIERRNGLWVALRASFKGCLLQSETGIVIIP